MSDTRVCTASADWSEKYLQAVFCTSEPSKNPELDALDGKLVVIRYPGNSWRYIKNEARRLIKLAFEYQLAAYQDFVLVVQGGAQICYPLIDFLYENDLKIKYSSGPGGSLIMSTTSERHERTINIPLRLRDKLVEENLRKAVDFGGSVRLVLHSMERICADLFGGPRMTENERSTGVKRPFFSTCPGYMSLVRCIQGVDRVPTFLMDTAMSNTAMKMKVDSLSILLGTQFQVDIILGIELHVDKKRRLESLDIVIFDATIKSLLAILRHEIFNGDQHRQAMAAFVLERKVLQNLCDVNALLRILSWDGADETLKTLIEDIKRDFRGYEPLLTLNRARPHFEPTKGYFEDCLRLYGDFREKLLEEQSDYETIAAICLGVRLTYKGKIEMETEQFRKDAESFVVKSLYYSRRIVKGIDGESEVEVKIPSTVLTGVPMSKNDYVSLSAEDLNSLYSTVRCTFARNTDEVREVLLSVPRNAIRHGRAKDVAAMNGCKSLNKLYERSSGTQKIRVRLLYLTDSFIRRFLVKWGVSPKGARDILLSTFIEQYDRRYPPDPEPSAGHIDREGRKRSADSKSPESKEGASKTSKSSTRRKKQRLSEFLPSECVTQSSTGQAESQTELLVGRAVEGSSEQ